MWLLSLDHGVTGTPRNFPTVPCFGETETSTDCTRETIREVFLEMDLGFSKTHFLTAQKDSKQALMTGT